VELRGTTVVNKREERREREEEREKRIVKEGIMKA
jgi:hypothetical protein